MLSGPSKAVLVALIALLLSSAGCAAGRELEPGGASPPGGSDAGAGRGGARPVSPSLFEGGAGPMAGEGGAPGSGPCDFPVLAGIVRDFNAYGGGQGHPDFEVFTGAGLKGIVEDTLGDDQKPVYALPGPSEMTSGKEAFDQWYRDVEGVNIPIPFTLTPEVDDDHVVTFDDATFFPADHLGWGEEIYGHNYHFTYELRASFVYHGGETFSFTGDDDLWVFLDGRLAIDLGGVHQAQHATIDLDARAADLGLEPGEEYTLALFLAERHTTESRFRIQTTLAFTSCDPIAR